MNKCPLTGMPCELHKCIHITDVGANYTCENELHLCQKCGTDFLEDSQQPKKKESSAAPSINTFFDLLELVLKEKFKVQIQKHAAAAEPLIPAGDGCPTCGCTLQNIAHTSRLGCPDCYEYFREQLAPVLYHAHKAYRHVGKVPKNFKKVIPDDVESLEKELSKLISEEKYEDAAIIKAKLNDLKNHS